MKINRLLNGMAAKFVALASLFYGSSAIAQEQDGPASVNGGLGKWLIDATFEAGSIGQMTDSPGWIGTVIMPMSMVAMAVAALVIIVKSIQHLLITAQSKDPSASPISMTWAPIHTALAVVLIMPMPSGYSLGQYAGLWVGQQSNTLGNISSERALQYVGSQGAITPAPVPELQHMVKAAVASNFCKVMYESGYSFLKAEFNTDADTGITPKITALDGSQGSGFEGRRVEFQRTGNFTNEGADINEYCGSMTLSYEKYKNEPINVGASCSSEGGSLICGALSNSKSAELLGNNLNKLHEDLAASLAQTAIDSGTSGVIARDLLYDMEAYLTGKLDTDSSEDYVAIQEEENARIDKAVKDTIKLYGNLQKAAYNGYATAIKGSQNQNEAGEDWQDVTSKIGWPAFGLYWFQMTKSSQRAMDATTFSFSGSADASTYIARFAQDADDPLLYERLTSRWDRYMNRLEREVQNTRHDIMPTITQRYDASGKVVVDDNEQVLAATGAMSDTSNLLPAMTSRMKSMSVDGSMDSEGIWNNAKLFFNDYTKGVIFPGVVNWMTEGDIVTSLVNTGHNLIAIHEVLYGINVVIRAKNAADEKAATLEKKKGIFEKLVDTVGDGALAVATGGISVAAGKVSGAIDRLLFATTFGQIFVIIFTDFVKAFTALFIVAVFMAFYIPAIILIQWLIGVVTWLIYLVEAIIVIPLWGLLFVSDMGSQALAPQSARQGLVHILSILFYPTLMVIGFVVGLKIVDIASTFFLDFLIIGINNMTEGFTFGLVSLAAALAIIGFASYQLITRIFSLVLEFNQRMMNWIGQYNNYGEQNVESQIRQGFIAFVQHGNQATRGLGEAKPNDPSGSKPGGKPTR